MVGTTIKMMMDENASEKINQVQVKKLTVPSNEATTKRAALGDLQNRGLNRVIASKDVANKELKDVKLTKARVDTHWKKQPLGVNNANTGAVKTTVPTLSRSNSIRTNAAPGGALTRQMASNVVQAGRIAAAPTGTTANAKVAIEAKSKRKYLPNIIKPTSKPKHTVTAAVSKQKSTSDEKLNTLRREDSNLSRKSLTKIRAALAKPVAPPPIAAAANVTKTVVTAGLLKKDAVAKKEPLVRQPKLRALPVGAIPVTKPPAISLSSKRLGEVEDIDAEDGDNLILVSQYVNDIYDYLYKLEEQQPIFKDHLSNQLEVSHKMRAVLIDWINEVHLQFHLAAETFHLAVAIIDRYLQAVKDTRRKFLQLVGVTALFIATKFEELFPPAISDFVFITDDTYTGREIRQMELQILKALDINLSRPLPIHFLRRYSKAASAEDEHHAMSKYFLELASLDYDLASYKPSEIAAASLFLSLHLLNGNARAATGFNDKHWTPTLVHYSRYTPAHLRPITRQIAKLARDAPTTKLKAIYNKYQGNKFQKIALRPELSGALLDSIVGNSKK